MSFESTLHGLALLPGFSEFNSLMEGPVFILFFAVVALAAFIILKKKSSRAALLLSIVLAVVLSTLLKLLYAEVRPCAGSFSCVDGYGFPSAHSALFFAIAMPMFGTKWFYGFLLVAVIVTLSRVVEGVHTIPQVVAGMALGFVCSVIANSVVGVAGAAYAKITDKRGKK